ncbi:MAG TPA: ATP-binding protein, partial [Limnobacter sp.]|nr:ATP-binding protein [Limnobacter sp.]
LVFGLAVQLLADYQAGYFGHVQATLLLGSVTVFTIYLVFRDTNRIIFLQLQAKQQLQESNQLLEETVQALTQERALVKKANEELNQELDVKAGSLQEAIKALSLQRIKTKAAFEARSRFLSTVSHELRGPLSAVLVLASAIQDRAQDDMRGLAEKLNLATLHLNGLVSDILELNKLEVGKLRLNQAPLELNGHLRRLVEWITPVAAEKGLYLRVISSLPNPCWIVADEMRLRQMMFNLVSNAIKFTSEGGVDIRASSVMEQSGDLSVQLEVLDTGPGIAEERLDSVFQPFEQENNSVASRFGGTGLGLSIVKELAQLMGGRVRVFSLEGIGSCFRIDLTFEPASPPEEVRKPVSPCPAFHRVRHHVRTEGLRNLRVLLVDDIALNLDVGRWVLEAHSCKVLEAKSGHEAIEIVRSEKIDLVLMDLHMPGLNGAETTQAMRDEIDMTQIPVIGLSGSDLEDDLAWCRKSGMYACITKPLDPRKLQEVLLAPAGGTIFGAPVEVSQS